jgi:uncharacterized protein
MAWAAHSGDADLVSALLDHGALPNARLGDKRLSPLHYALHPSTTTVYVEVARVLIERGADPKDLDADGRSPLHYLASRIAAHTQEPKQAAVELLLEHGADAAAADEGGDTPLHYASAVGDSTTMLQLLLDHGASVSAANDSGFTALDAAVSSDHPPLAVFFFERGATPHVLLEAPSWPKDSLEVHRQFEISGKGFAFFGDWQRERGDTEGARAAYASSESQLRLGVAEFQRAVGAYRSAANQQGPNSREVATSVVSSAIGITAAALTGIGWVSVPGKHSEAEAKLNARADELGARRAATQKLLDEVSAKRAALAGAPLPLAPKDERRPP